MTIDFEALRSLAVKVAAEACDLLVAGVDEARASARSKSSATDMVTALDHRSEALILRRLTDARPDDGFLGEEGADRSGTTGLRWVVDPLDGTTNYLYGYPGWNVSIGAELDGVASLGVVQVPALGEVYSAGRGLGAHLHTTDGVRRLLAVDPPPLDTMLVGTGFSYDPPTRLRQGEVMARLLPHVRDVRRGGAAAADLCYVASGRLDAFYEWGLAPWDRCAGSVVVAEAGLRCEVVAEASSGRVLTVAAHRERFDALVDLLAGAGALDAD